MRTSSPSAGELQLEMTTRKNKSRLGLERSRMTQNLWISTLPRPGVRKLIKMLGMHYCGHSYAQLCKERATSDQNPIATQITFHCKLFSAESSVPLSLKKVISLWKCTLTLHHMLYNKPWCCLGKTEVQKNMQFCDKTEQWTFVTYVGLESNSSTSSTATQEYHITVAILQHTIQHEPNWHTTTEILRNRNMLTV